MIISIGSNLYKIVDKLNSITTISDMLDMGVLMEKPDEYSGIYIYLSIVSDNIVQNSDNRGSLMKRARISFNIIGDPDSTKIALDDTIQDYLYRIVDTINQEIVDEGCCKIGDWDGFKILGVEESSISPVLRNEKNRPYIVKDYIFTYLSK